jgi:hypothetical protein
MGKEQEQKQHPPISNFSLSLSFSKCSISNEQQTNKQTNNKTKIYIE